jgi:D-aspartate ligase
MSARPNRRIGRGGPLACVIGSMDLVRALGLAGIRCAAVAHPHDLTRYSRFTSAVVEWADPRTDRNVLLERLLRFAESQERSPVLYYEGDWDLLLVSRERDALRHVFRFVMPDAELVEDVVDKSRFWALAERLPLPVPTSRRVDPAHVDLDELGIPFPVVVKPVTRYMATWRPIAGGAKALRADTAEELKRIWPRLAGGGFEVLVQRLIAGPETRIESYHVYVDERDEVVSEFTGRKIRTYPPEYGFSTALEITDEPDVARLGRELTGRMGLRGVAKLDFKRDDGGALHLLEVNPRFNLWHHPGARAGVNLPELVYRDLVGLPRPPLRRARPGVRWVYQRHDARAARAVGIPLRRWIRWALSCEAKSSLALDDPMPVVRSRLSRLAGVSRRRAQG